MFKDWDSRLSKLAREVADPEKLLEKTSSYRQGFASGKRKQLPIIALAGVLGVAVGAAAAVGAAKLKQIWDQKAEDCDFIDLPCEDPPSEAEETAAPETVILEDEEPEPSE